MRDNVLVKYILGSAIVAAALTLGFAAARADAAVIIRDAGCGLFDGDGNLVAADRDQSVITRGGAGNTILKCKVEGVANSTGQAVHYDAANNPTGIEIPCGTASGSTNDWHEVVSASGQATLTCKLKP